eukprot:3185652-Amphidinium_carterae.1
MAENVGAVQPAPPGESTKRAAKARKGQRAADDARHAAGAPAEAVPVPPRCDTDVFYQRMVPGDMCIPCM